MAALDHVPTIQAAKELQTTVLDIQESLIRGELPIGYAQKRRGRSRYNYVILRGLLDEYKGLIESGMYIQRTGLERTTLAQPELAIEKGGPA